ncbi:MAG: hypothetical protein ACI4U2_00245 [Christensenellaceae bacterium]
MNRKNGNELLKIILLSLLIVAIGTALIVVPVAQLIWLSFVLLGIAIVASAIPELIHQIHFLGEEPFSGFVATLVRLVLGFLLIFWQQPVLMIVIGVLLVVLPLIRVFSCSERMFMLKRELPTIVIGVILIFVGPASFLEILFRVAGGITVALGVAYFVWSLVMLCKKSAKKDGDIEYHHD